MGLSGMILWFAIWQRNRSSLESIQNLQVPSAMGALIPLNELAEITFLDGQTNIYRLNGKRMSTIRTNIRGRDQGGFVSEAGEKIDKTIHIPSVLMQ